MVEEIEYKPRNLKGEIKPIIAILEDEESEEKSVAQIADEIVSALDEVRSKKSQVCVVARVSLDHGETWQFFVMGPYKTMAVAKTKGESLAGTANVTVKWLRLAMVADHRAFVKELMPKEEKSAWAGEVPVERIKRTVWLEPDEPEESE